MTATPRTAEAVCLVAADYIEEHGWTRKAFRRSGRVCMQGGLLAVNQDNDLHYQALGLIADVVGTQMTIAWNDEQKSRRPVLAALRKAGGQ